MARSVPANIAGESVCSYILVAAMATGLPVKQAIVKGRYAV